MKIFGIVGWKNSGKTTLICRLVEHFNQQGLRVSTLKHTHHQLDLDRPGKDSYLHRASGAQETMLVSGRQWALFSGEARQQDMELQHLLPRFEAADLLLIEGFKQHDHPKIQVYRAGSGADILCDQVPNIAAIACDPDSAAGLQHSQIPAAILALDDIQGIATFILEHSQPSP